MTNPALPRALRGLVALAVVLFSGACSYVQLGGPSPTGAGGIAGTAGIAGGRASVSPMDEAAAICECWVQQITEYEQAVLSDSQGVPAPKGVMGTEFIGCLSPAARTASVPAATTNLGAVMPSGKKKTAALFSAVLAGGGKMRLEVTKSGLAILSLDRPAHGAPIGAEAEIGRRTNDIGLAFLSSMQASQSCTTYAVSNAMQSSVSGHHGGSGLDPAREREGAKRLLAAAHSADALAASNMGLLASIQSVVAGSGDPKTLDATITGLAAALPVKATATDADVDAIYAIGKAQADVFEKNLKDWAAESRGLHGHIPGVAGSGVAAAPARSTGSSGPTLEAPSEASDASTLANAVTGLMHGDAGAVMAGAALIFPKDSSIRVGLQGAAAVLHGDVKGAIHAAAKLAPKDSKIAAVLGTADQVLSAGRGIAGALGTSGPRG